MKPGEIIVALPVRPLLRIAPSRFVNLRACALRELWLGAAQPPLLPRSPASILGTLAHAVLAYASNASSGAEPIAISSRWDEMAVKTDSILAGSWLERSLHPLSRSASLYEVVRLRVFQQAAMIHRNTKTGGSSLPRPQFGFEVKVCSRDGLISGRVDWVYPSREGPVIADFKSGHVLEDPSATTLRVKPGHQVQLRMYAALYASTYGQWPARLQVVPLAGKRVPVEFHRPACEALVTEAARALTSLNTEVKRFLASGDFEAAQRLANPHHTICRVCLYRPGCPAYLRSLARQPTDHWPNDLLGTVTHILPIRRERVNVTLARDNGTSTTVRALSSSGRHPALSGLKTGEQLSIFNFVGRGTKSDATEGPLTTVYRMTQCEGSQTQSPTNESHD
ncbi:MAG: PD-(D/E)XK nuclease family protein [Acidobacteria bacterium]|nr:PD-(D/E)XK nuclease family protein [Acidobacteriota bacterium]MCI0724380.1 PD-(D/E)XK nuclease family protein [Acidobacteriota bacterium]